MDLPDSFLAIILTLVLAVSALGGVALVALGFPGQLLMPLIAGLLWLFPLPDGALLLSGGDIALLLVIAGVAELIEGLSGMLGSRRAGGSIRAALGAVAGGLAGGLLGTFLIPILFVGSIIGLLSGTFLGAFLAEKSLEGDVERSLGVGPAALIGRIVGVVIKGSTSVGMLIFLLVRFLGY